MRKNTTGFTLIELLITMLLLSILVGFAIPGMSTITKNDRLTTQINSLNGHLAYARSEAVKRSQQVGICVSINSGTTTPSCTGGTDWELGWLVYVDSDGDDTFSGDEDILRVQTLLDGDNKLKGSVAQIIYDYRGFVKTAFVGSFVLCDHRGAAHGKSIAVTLTGRVKKQEVSTC